MNSGADISRAGLLDRLAAGRAALERAPLPPSVAALFDAAVARHGDRPLWVAADGDGPSLSYREMAALVARASAAFAALGIGAGTHVALMLPAVPALAVAWMALARLGAVMVPVNTRYTAPELDHVLREGEAEWLLLDAEHLALADGSDGRAVPLPRARMLLHGAAAPPPGFAGHWDALLAEAPPRLPPLPAPEPDRLHSLQFTSGSTGAPKACMLTHRYWVQIAHVRAQQGPPVARMLIDMPFHYMGGQWRFLMALVLGATAVVARQQSLARLLDRLAAQEIGFCSVTPALAKQPLDPRREALRLAWAGTMAMPADLHRALEERLGGAPVREMYGLTETGAALAMPVAVDWMTGSGCCGLPVAFRRLRVAGPDGSEVPAGTTGELWIQGDGLMLGYHRREAATAETLREGWLRTGDLVRRDADGFHQVLGRIKDVIRRSGENISASEIETVLTALPEVVEAAAIPVPDELRGEEVKICLLLRPGLSPAELPPERVMEHCRTRLARFKLPRYISYLPELPKTSSGKIAKAALRPAGADLRLGAYDTTDALWR